MSSPHEHRHVHPLDIPPLKKFTNLEVEDMQSPDVGSRSGRSFSRLKQDDYRTLSALSLHTNLQEILASNNASIQNHAVVNWIDPNISCFDPDGQGIPRSNELEQSARKSDHELALLMEENLFEVENNFPTFDKIQHKIDRQDQEYIRRMQNKGPNWGYQSPPGVSTPMLMQESSKLQRSAIQEQRSTPEPSKHKQLIESFGSSQENTTPQVTTPNRRKGVDWTLLDRAALDVENQSSRISLKGNEIHETEGFQPQEMVLEQEFRSDFKKSPSPIPPLFKNPTEVGRSQKASVSTGLNLQNSEECEVSDMDTDTPFARYEYYSSLSSRQRQSQRLVASQQLFEDLLVATKTGSEPVDIGRRKTVNESKTDSA